MQKILSLFKRNYEGNRLVYDEIVEGSEWVQSGEGVATVKYDGTACMVRNGVLYKRSNRRAKKATRRQRIKNRPFVKEDFKAAPVGWLPAESEPNVHTGHWPGWMPVGDGPEDKWHREAWETNAPDDGTYELVGPKVQGNPQRLLGHNLWKHGNVLHDEPSVPRTYDELADWFQQHDLEGIVWHHPDGRMVKIKRRDFGLAWPPLPLAVAAD